MSFQGSENTGVRLRVYPHDNPGTDPGDFDFTGRTQDDKAASVVSVRTSKALGAPSGSWTAVLRPGRRTTIDRLLAIADDDWIDLEFRRHDRTWHSMRGLVDTVNHAEATGAGGATTDVVVLTGRDFGKIWERSSIWFDPYSQESIGGSVSQRIWGAREGNFGPPTEAVFGFLQGMLLQAADRRGTMWELPAGLPGRGAGTFPDVVVYDGAGIPTSPALLSVGTNWLCPEGVLWNLAQEWSDSQWNELWVDIRRRNGTSRERDERGLQVADTEMAVIFRRRPFPTTDETATGDLLTSLDAGTAGAGLKRWRAIPERLVPRGQVHEVSVTKGGHERFNAFFVAPQLTQALLGQSGLDLMRPLVDRQDARRHGFLRCDVQTRYTPQGSDVISAAVDLQALARDWNCLNAELLSGSIELAVLRPDIRVGERLTVAGHTPDRNRTFYVEQVDHTWAVNQGRTSLGVTRGFTGSEEQHVSALRKAAGRYQLLNSGIPAPEPL